MVETLEQAPIPPERLASIARWLETRVRPVMHEVESSSLDMTEFEQEFEKRDYQLEAWARLEDARVNGRTRALGELATGLGKTFVAAVDVMRYREECASMNPPMTPRILYVSHKHEINKQAYETFQGLMPDLDVDFFKTGRKQMREADLTFATIQSLYSELGRFDPQDYEYIIWDESHHLEADTYKVVRDFFDPLFEHAITATVERMDGKDIKEYFGESLYKKTLPEGIAEGWLADVDYHIVLDKAIKDELAGGFNPKTLQEIKDLFKEKAPPEVIARNIKEEIERLGLVDPKTIIFCDSIQEADVMAELLGGKAYHSETKDKDAVLQSYRSGAERIITTKDMFNEGVNIPDAELIIFLRATESGPVFEQQLGRGLRRTRGKDKVYVLDFVANIERIAKVRELGEAIKRRAQELGQNTTEEGAIYDDVPDSKDDRTGFRLRTAHGDFDFDKIAVDLLERWGMMQHDSRYNKRIGLTNDEIVTLALSIKPDGPLSQAEINTLSQGKQFVSGPTITDRFGSLKAFQEACGFEVKTIADMTNDELVALAQTLKPEGPLKMSEINAFSKNKQFVSAQTVQVRFGSIRAFQEACGHKAKDMSKMTDSELIALAKRLKPDGPLTASEIDALSKGKQFVSYEVIANRFGSLGEFQGVCGFQVGTARQMTNEELVDQALALKPDGPLTKAEITALSKNKQFISDVTIGKRFGSLRAFQEACRRAIQKKP